MAKEAHTYNIGALDRRITVQNYTESTDSFGQKVRSYATYKELWASVQEKSGTEGESGNQLVASKQVVFVIRYRTDLSETMRIVYGSWVYRIESIIADDARKSFLKIVARWAD